MDAQNWALTHDDPDASTRFVLDRVLGAYPALIHVDELAREYARSSVPSDAARPAIDDAVAELVAGGLAHRIDSFVFASRAAVRAGDLAQ